MLFAILILSCAKDKAIADTRAEKGEPALLAFIAGLDSAYALGSKISFQMVVVPKSKKSVKITFPSACRADFIVYRGDEPIWNSIEGVMCAQMINKATVSPSDTLVFNAIWDGGSKSFRGVTLGKYQIQGILLTSPPIRTESATFYLVD